MSINIKRVLSLVFCFFCFFSIVNLAQAANLGNAFKVTDGKNSDPLDTAASRSGYSTSAEKTDILPLFSKIINIGLSFLGVLFLLLILYAGFLWMSDQGNEDQVAKAKKIITAAAIGLIIVISSYAISWFIFNVLMTATQKTVE
jgi:hypothetical protein